MTFSGYFDVVDFKEVVTGKTILNGYPEKELHFYLDEIDIMHRNEDEYRPNGFTEECVVHDFPIRDRKAILHVRRRLAGQLPTAMTRFLTMESFWVPGRHKTVPRGKRLF